MQLRRILENVTPLLTLALLASPRAALAQSTSGKVIAHAAAPAEQGAPAPEPVVASAPAPAAPELSPLDAYLKRHPFFLGAWGGFALASMSHPEVRTGRVMGPILSLNVGYTISRRWVAALELTSFVVSIERQNAGERFSAASSWLHAQAECTNCKPKENGGFVTRTALAMSTVGPRVEVSPFGGDGLYLGASGGFVFLNGLQGTIDDSARLGGSGTGRLGFRLRPTNSVSLALEAGAQGQAFRGGSAALFFGALQGRFHL